MGKLSWNDLRLIYEGQFGVTADEANKWIAKELFTKNWYGTQKQPGRMWEDIENCLSFSELLIEIEKFKKEKSYKQTVAATLMHEEKHKAVKKFASDIKRNIFSMSSKTFANYVGMWKRQLTEVGFLTRKQTYTEREVIKAALKQEKKNKNLKLLIQRSNKIRASRRK